MQRHLGSSSSRDACTGCGVSTGIASAPGAGPSPPRKEETESAVQRECSSILCIAKATAASHCIWGDSPGRAFAQSQSCSPLAHLGTLLFGFRCSIIQRPQQTRQNQQQHDLTQCLPAKGPVPSTSGFPASRRKGKKGGAGREHSPVTASPTQTSSKAFPRERGLHSQHPCVQTSSPPPPSPLPPPKLALGPHPPEQSRRGLLL